MWVNLMVMQMMLSVAGGFLGVDAIIEWLLDHLNLELICNKTKLISYVGCLMTFLNVLTDNIHCWMIHDW